MNNSGLPWGNLVEQGRAKAIGIPWSEADLQAIYDLKIPVEFVREGILTLEDYERVSAKQQVPETKSLRYMKREELIDLAKSKGIEFDESNVGRADLILMMTPVNQ